jgi:hypothetical protein
VATRYRTEQLPIELVQNGMTLAVKNDQGQPALFQVNSKGFEHKPPGPILFTIKSEPLESGKQWVIQKPAGTLMVRILGTYDDGT